MGLAVLLLFSVRPVTAQAESTTPYLGYEYNSSEESVPAPVGYEPVELYVGSDIGCGALQAPTDMCFYEDELYILDSGNSRIVVVNAQMELVRVIDHITANGETLDFKGALGLYVCSDGNLLIADTAGARIIECANDGSFLRFFTKPDSSMIDQGITYSVKKVIRDYNGVTYAVVDGINEGAVTYLADGSFAGFFASNEVEQTAEVILNYIWRSFMTEEQIRNSATASPSSITAFDIADKGFLYTVTQSGDAETSVRLLNFKGTNLETETAFGDLELDGKIKNPVFTIFCDVDVDQENYVYLLDSARGRVFVYSKDGYLITIFGGKGDQLGLNESPVALETNGDCVYVLDDLRGSITVYRSNDYLNTVKAATNLLQQGKYSESREYWEKVLSINSNSTIAYYGIGLALDESGAYAESLKYFKLAYENEAYSEAFKEVRKEFVKEHFVVLLMAAVLFFALLWTACHFLKKRFGRKNEYEVSALEGKYTAPFFVMRHPISGFEMLKKEKKWFMPAALGILGLLFLTLTAKWFLTGFSFNTNRALDYNVFVTFLQAFLIVSVTTIANWAVCTLMQGKGRLIDIFCTLSYGLLPYVFSQILYVILSQAFTQDEEAFLTAITIIGIGWSACLIFAGFMEIHQFSFKETVASIILTVIGIAVIIFLAVLFVGLLEQVVSFFKAIVSEAIMMQ